MIVHQVKSSQNLPYENAEVVVEVVVAVVEAEVPPPYYIPSRSPIP